MGNNFECGFNISHNTRHQAHRQRSVTTCLMLYSSAMAQKHGNSGAPSNQARAVAKRGKQSMCLLLIVVTVRDSCLSTRVRPGLLLDYQPAACIAVYRVEQGESRRGGGIHHHASGFRGDRYR
jgi:hypothetical protein